MEASSFSDVSLGFLLPSWLEPEDLCMAITLDVKGGA